MKFKIGDHVCYGDDFGMPLVGIVIDRSKDNKSVVEVRFWNGKEGWSKATHMVVAKRLRTVDDYCNSLRKTLLAVRTAQEKMDSNIQSRFLRLRPTCKDKNLYRKLTQG